MKISTGAKLLLTIIFFLLLPFAAAIHAQSRSILIRNATIIDGTGRPAFHGDLRIAGGKIGAIKPFADDEIIDANGLVRAPALWNNAKVTGNLPGSILRRN